MNEWLLDLFAKEELKEEADIFPRAEWETIK